MGFLSDLLTSPATSAQIFSPQANADPCGTASNDITYAGATSCTIATFATQQYQGKDFCSWSSSPLDPEEAPHQAQLNFLGFVVLLFFFSKMLSTHQ